jgi:aminodeoxyfutalosine deaminase
VLVVSADWVLPVSGPPIRDGAVVVAGDRIVAVGSRTELEGRESTAERRHFPGCVIVPGLVNAHTHLTLTALAGVVPPLPFTEWLPCLVAALKPWEVADHEASGVIGAEQCLQAGVTVVGDIAYGAAEVASAARAGLGGVFYWELLGMRPDEVARALARLRYPEHANAYGARVTCGLSPHSPYTSGPGLLRAVHDRARELGVPVAIHIAESAAEVELLRDGTGPLVGVASRQAIGFRAPGTTTVRYLDELGALDAATAIHVCYASDEDLALLASGVRGVVTCPRSNRYLDNPPPRIAPLIGAGVAIGIGTDSSASNEDLDLMAEVRALSASEPALSAETLLKIATIGGAKAIGVDDRFGTLDADKQADLAIFAIDVSAHDPAASVVGNAGRDSVEAVMSGGEWRVLGARLLSRDADATARSADAAARARDALAVL